MIAILSTTGIPLNPTNDFGKVRILLKNIRQALLILKKDVILRLLWQILTSMAEPTNKLHQSCLKSPHHFTATR